MEEANFPFPREPYPVQKAFMREMYAALSQGQSGIFQSPTGTGKTLSIICSAFKWLEDNGHFASSHSEPSEGHEKLIYCTRTHSQIAQFIAELKLTVYGKLKTVVLGSRKKLCIHEGAHESEDVNEFCKTLREKKSHDKEGCIYKQSAENIKPLILSKLMDIEELATAGRECRECPYYGAIKAMPDAEAIIAPYQYLLSRSIRLRFNLTNKSTAVVIDEGHNLVDTIIDCNSYQKSIAVLDTAATYLHEAAASITPDFQVDPKEVPGDASAEELKRQGLTLHKDLEDAEQMIGNVLRVAHAHPRANEVSVGYEPMDFLARCNVDVPKLKSISDRLANSDWEYWASQVLVRRDNVEQLMSLSEAKKFCSAIRWMASYSHHPECYRIITKVDKGRLVTITAMLLDPEKEFQVLLKDSRCVIVAGGTMDPKEEFFILFKSLQPEQLRVVDFDHVIPPENLKLAVISQDDTGKPLNVIYRCRKEDRVFRAICNVLVNLCEIVPNGIVCFFGSFQYLSDFNKFATKNGFIQTIAELKKLHFDDRKNAFETFQSDAKTEKGAIIFTVVRGSLSEGINFKHEVGRCAVVIGQPYPNELDAEVQAKKQYWDHANNGMTGATYLSNCCFKAVNQCIGRVIRDIQDYAVVVLVDARYLRNINKLSAWARRSRIFPKNPVAIYREIRDFFISKSSN